MRFFPPGWISEFKKSMLISISAEGSVLTNFYGELKGRGPTFCNNFYSFIRIFLGEGNGGSGSDWRELISPSLVMIDFLPSNRLRNYRLACMLFIFLVGSIPIIYFIIFLFRNYAFFSFVLACRFKLRKIGKAHNNIWIVRGALIFLIFIDKSIELGNRICKDF